jgi:hydroxyethylthiazole kinase-like uncharacterized protein yjeF
MYLVTADEMRRMDRLTIESFGLSGQVLMENAGQGATQVFLEKIAGEKPRRVGIIAGRGNNGGDGFVVARYLSQRGWPVTVYLLAEKERVGGDAAINLNLLKPLNIPIVEIPDTKTFHQY